MTMGRSRLVTALILLAVLFAGIACLAVLPPWEGADETAHWSYVQELADLGHAPVAGRDAISRDVDLYPGPQRYGDSSPFDRTGFATYRSVHRAHLSIRDSRPTHFVEGTIPNWQAQHPPLYYAVLAPLYRATRTLPFRDHLFDLRLASWAMAFAGLAIGVLATAYLAPPWAQGAAPLMAAWPFLVPQVFPSLARLGNDSLCLLEAGVLWLLILRLSERPGRWGEALAIGATLGCGLLTKALFVPITAGACAYIVFLGWRSGGLARSGLVRGLAMAAAALALAAVMSGGWYMAQYTVTHDLTGGGDFVALQRQGGLGVELAKNYSLFAVIRGFAAMAATFAWTGTWSLARPPEILILGPLVLVGAPLVLWLKGLPKAPVLAWAPLFLAAPLLASLAYHVFAFVALTGRGASTPGYYLHILAAPLGFAVALGWRRGLLLPALWLYTALFTIAAWGLELSMFSGCAAKIGDNAHFSFAGADCLVDWTQAEALGHPLPAAVSLILCGLLLIASLATAWRGRSAPSQPENVELTAL